MAKKANSPGSYTSGSDKGNAYKAKATGPVSKKNPSGTKVKAQKPTYR